MCVEQCPARPRWVHQLCPCSAPGVPGLPRKAPFQVVPQTPHPGSDGNGVLLLLLRAAVERSWEELPAHPSHTNLAFMKNLKQQILSGTCVVVGVKEGLSKIPTTPAMCLIPSGTQRTLLGLAQGLSFLGKGTPGVPLATLQFAHLPAWTHSWTGVVAIMFECISRTGTAPTAWLSGARDYGVSGLVLQTGVVASGVLHSAVLPSTRQMPLTGLSPGKSCEDGQTTHERSSALHPWRYPKACGCSPENPALGDPA